MLAPLDWVVILAYMALALAVGLAMREGSSTGTKAYFLANRSLPWWWAGTSIAATTFAADTPLAVSGIIADRGISGNWMWLSWILLHASVIAIFARRWWRSDVVTDAEFIQRRYNDKGTDLLRTARAGLYGLVYNVIILGWVLRAMGKIADPLVPWEKWFPGLVHALTPIVPPGSPLGDPGELLTIVALVAVVALYSSLGGIRGVVRTDLIQFALGLAGSVWLAVVAWNAVGGRSGLHDRMFELYGADSHRMLSLFPTFSGSGWVNAIGLGATAFGFYLLIQAFANVPADGGGYLQQRLSASRSEGDAVKAAWLFVILQYLVRTWPWFVVGVVALVMVPLNGGPAMLPPDLAATVRADREAAYPALMLALLPPGALGLLVVSLLAAFMSTIDTHFNWGASYAVTDIVMRLKPDLAPRTQVTVARVMVILYAVLAVLVAMQIDTIEQAWKWVAALGAALGPPTLLRWFWWRVTAVSELAGASVGLGVAVVTALLGVTYERQLLWIAAFSSVFMLTAIALGPRSDRQHAAGFARMVRPPGFWPGRSFREGGGGLGREVALTFGIVAVVVAGLVIGQRILFAT